MQSSLACGVGRFASGLLLALPLACGSGAPAPPSTSGAASAAAPGGAGAPFDRVGAAEAIDELQEDASRCGVPGAPTGQGKATIVFDPSSGHARVAEQAAPFAGSPVAPCVERVFGAAHVSPFRGAAVTVRIGFMVTPPDAPPAFSVRTAKMGVRTAVAQCHLLLRSAREVADEVDVHFSKSGAVDTVEFFRFEDHQKLDSKATQCLRKALTSARVAAFASDEERAVVKLFFTDGT